MAGPCYYRGERVPDVTRHPVISRRRQSCVDRLSSSPTIRRHRDLAVVERLEDGEYSRYYQIPRSADDLPEARRARSSGRRRPAARCVVLIKEIGSDALCALDARRFRARCQVREARYASAASTLSTDTADRERPRRRRRPDGRQRATVRSGRPPRPIPTSTCTSSTARADGIVVRGAKAHTSVSTNANETRSCCQPRAMARSGSRLRGQLCDSDRHAGSDRCWRRRYDSHGAAELCRSSTRSALGTR